MIESINKLSPEDRKHVLQELHKRGITTGKEYVRYSYLELENIAAFLDSYAYQIDEKQADLLLSKFCQTEQILFKKILNTTANRREGMPADVKKMTDRTRLAVRRIMSKKAEASKPDIPVNTRFQKLMKSILA